MAPQYGHANGVNLAVSTSRNMCISPMSHHTYILVTNPIMQNYRIISEKRQKEFTGQYRSPFDWQLEVCVLRMMHINLMAGNARCDGGEMCTCVRWHAVDGNIHYGFFLMLVDCHNSVFCSLQYMQVVAPSCLYNDWTRRLPRMSTCVPWRTRRRPRFAILATSCRRQRQSRSFLTSLRWNRP